MNKTPITKMIGRNIRPDTTPGGLTGGAKARKAGRIGNAAKRVSREDVHAAAVAALERRGLGQRPSAFETLQRLPAEATITHEKAHAILAENRSEYS